MSMLFRLIRLAGLALAAFTLLALTGPMAGAQSGEGEGPSVYIPIVPEVGRRYKLAICDLAPLNGRSDRNATYLPERLTANLAMTGLFTNLDRRSFLETNLLAGVDGSSPDYTAWSRIGADFLIKGGLSSSGSSLTLDMRLFDVGLSKEMLAKRYSGPAKDARRMINQFTNAVLEAITGVPGVFGSQIIFTTGPAAKKTIMITELGSDEATAVAGNRGGPSTQPTLGPGGRMAWIHRNGTSWELLLDGKVVSSGPTHLSPAFKPDGTLVAAYSEPLKTSIFTFSGRSKTLLTGPGGINVSPTFSPDGSRMAFVSDLDGSVGIYTSPASGGAPGKLPITGKATDPAWSPTGEFIVFVSRETDICIIRPDGSGYRQLTGGQGSNYRPSFSPDGRLIVFSSTRNGREQLFVMSANGDSQQLLLPELSANQDLPYWCPTMPAAYK